MTASRHLSRVIANAALVLAIAGPVHVQGESQVVERQLVPLPGGYQRGVIDGYAVVYGPRSRVIIDVVALIGPR